MSEERCPLCGGPVERVVIDGHDSWACPKDASAWSVDQDEDYHDDSIGDDE
jgi:hypothetical protein